MTHGTRNSRIVLRAFYRKSDDYMYDRIDARSAVESSDQISSALKPSLVQPTRVHFPKDIPACQCGGRGGL